jgi:CheY-like chemotaxis protein
LLSFSRRQPVEPKRIDVNAIVADMGSLLRRTIAEHIRLVTDLEPGLGSVLADPGQLEQVVLNLAVNAKDAMPQGGTLTIRTNEVGLAAADLPADADGPPGRYVVLSVTDTGHGMDDATKARIFEPFFTTKEVGKGTGLGLATVYGIIKQANGWVSVDSRPGGGATFRVYLPRTAGQAEEAPGPQSPAAASRGSETILLVEDESAVRDLAKRTLEAAGYTVLTCPDGKTAEEASRRYTGTIDLLVTDLIMPFVNGRQLAKTLIRERPGLRVLFMSGYSESVVAGLGPSQSEEELLDKPFVPGDLTRRVRKLLDKH